MEQLRFIKTEYTYADFSTSISPAIELALERRQVESTVILNTFGGGSFTVGVLEDPEKSLDLDYCRREKIVVRRRQNAGGSIWGPDGGAIIVITVDTDLPWVPMKRIEDAFRITLNNLASTFQELYSIKAVYRPVNDVEVEGRKLIPSSARLEKGILTVRLLINVAPTNQDILRKALRTPVEKIQDKKIKDVGERFTCLQQETGREISSSDLDAITKRTIEKIFGEEIELVPREITGLEKKYAAEYQEKYTSDAWFFENSERFRFKDIPPDALRVEGRHKAPAGLIRVTLLILRDEIHDLIITGDFHPTPYQVLKDMECALRGKPCNIDLVKNEIKQIFHRPDVEIAGTDVNDFLAAFTKAFTKALDETGI